MSTVGFGDIYPKTNAGRLVVCGSIFAGVLVVPKQAAELVDALLKRSRRKEQAERKKNAVYYNTLNTKKSVEWGTSATTKEDARAELCTSCGTIVHSNQARFCWYCGCELEADSE